MDLKCMVEENRCQSRGDLLDDIKRGSRLLEQQLSLFIDRIGDRQILSFGEMQQTRKLQKVCICMCVCVLSGLFILLHVALVAMAAGSFQFLHFPQSRLTPKGATLSSIPLNCLRPFG